MRLARCQVVKNHRHIVDATLPDGYNHGTASCPVEALRRWPLGESLALVIDVLLKGPI